MAGKKHRWAQLLGKKGAAVYPGRLTPEEKKEKARRNANLRWERERLKKYTDMGISEEDARKLMALTKPNKEEKPQ